MPFDDMERAIADLRAIPREVRRELTPVLKKTGGAAASDARGRASWSARIAAAMTVKVRYGQRRPGVVLRVAAKRAPHARPYEGLGVPGIFRHPGWGDREQWYTQVRRPCAWPAVHAKRGEIQRDINRVVEVAARRHGFH